MRFHNIKRGKGGFNLGRGVRHIMGDACNFDMKKQTANSMSRYINGPSLASYVPQISVGLKVSQQHGTFEYYFFYFATKGHFYIYDFYKMRYFSFMERCSWVLWGGGVGSTRCPALGNSRKATREK